MQERCSLLPISLGCGITGVDGVCFGVRGLGRRSLVTRVAWDKGGLPNAKSLIESSNPLDTYNNVFQKVPQAISDFQAANLCA